MTTKLRAGVFIDGSNILWAMKQNYNIDFEKLKHFLEEQYSPVFCNYYICVNRAPTKEPYITRASNTNKFINTLEIFGYTVKKKDLKMLKNGQTKCDTDIEIVMDLHRYSNDLDMIILFTGDSDFRAAVEVFHAQGKNIRIYAFKSSLSWELRKSSVRSTEYEYILLDDLQDKIQRL